jgi:hypothetical protein
MVDLPGVRQEIPENAAIVARGASIEHRSFNPVMP